jgi:tetratricopeptide (TPR) repeat protein
MENIKNNAAKHILAVIAIIVLGAVNILLGLLALVIYIVYLLVTYRKQVFSRESKASRILLKLVIPLSAIIALFFYNRILCLAALFAYIILLMYSLRSSIFSFMGTLKYSRGDIDEAVRWFKKAHETHNTKPRAEISYAYLQLKQGNLEEAESILNSLLSTNLQKDDEMNAKSNLALVLWKKSRLDDAISLMEEVIDNYKTSAVYGSLGYLLIEKGNLDKALAFNLEAYDYNGRNAVIADNLGQTYYSLGEYDKAEELYKNLMSANPSFPEAYYNYALVLEKLGRLQEALETIRKASDYKLSFLSTVTKEEIEAKSEEIRKRLE